MIDSKRETYYVRGYVQNGIATIDEMRSELPLEEQSKLTLFLRQTLSRSQTATLSSYDPHATPFEFRLYEKEDPKKRMRGLPQTIDDSS